MDPRHYTDIRPKDAIRTISCTLIAVISLLACGGDTQRAATAPQDPTPASATQPTPDTTISNLLDSLKGSLQSATSGVQEAVSPHAAGLQELGKEEVEKLLRWEYKVETLPANSSPDDIGSRLEGLGTERWDCFALQPHGEHLLLTCKRRPKSALSYLKCLTGM